MNRIGLDSKQAKGLANSLNELLANYQVFYMNTRSFHWNIKGNKFFELHVKFEELYNDLLIKVDEIAERVLTLGETPIHTYTDYLEISIIKEEKNVTDANPSVESLLHSFEVLLKKQREILDLSGQADDEGTSALMSDYIREQEKLVWMYSAYLS
ncbi:MAG: DNA starvation/stationary phase protection protein [Cytophagales bacterium]|nr:DNA starvation/stationary phase protection protein [Cytophagales bacterium]